MILHFGGKKSVSNYYYWQKFYFKKTVLKPLLLLSVFNPPKVRKIMKLSLVFFFSVSPQCCPLSVCGFLLSTPPPRTSPLYLHRWFQRLLWALIILSITVGNMQLEWTEILCSEPPYLLVFHLIWSLSWFPCALSLLGAVPGTVQRDFRTLYFEQYSFYWGFHQWEDKAMWAYGQEQLLVSIYCNCFCRDT